MASVIHHEPKSWVETGLVVAAGATIAAFIVLVGIFAEASGLASGDILSAVANLAGATSGAAITVLATVYYQRTTQARADAKLLGDLVGRVGQLASTLERARPTNLQFSFAVSKHGSQMVSGAIKRTIALLEWAKARAPVKDSNMFEQFAVLDTLLPTIQFNADRVISGDRAEGATHIALSTEIASAIDRFASDAPHQIALLRQIEAALRRALS